jgi:hypothetical protein
VGVQPQRDELEGNFPVVWEVLIMPLSQSHSQPHSPEFCAVSNGDSWFPKGTATGLAVAAAGRRERTGNLKASFQPHLSYTGNTCHSLAMQLLMKPIRGKETHRIPFHHSKPSSMAKTGKAGPVVSILLVIPHRA